MARPERFELPTTKFVAWYSIQLSYGREAVNYSGWAAGRQALRDTRCIAGVGLLPAASVR
jgi:hypothetical protein